MERAIGRSAAGRRDRTVGRGRAALLLCLFAIPGVCLTSAATAAASPSSFTWAGVSTNSEGWSFPANWEGDVAPTAEIGTLTFPRLTSTACTTEPDLHPCYISFNDVPGLSAESLQIYDGNDYLIGGEELKLGSGGLTASPESGSGGAAGAFVELPLYLSASQRWSITDRSGGKIEENGLLLGGGLTGTGSALTVELSNGPALIFANNTEVGPMTIEGPNAGGEHIDNGSVFLEDSELNSLNQQAVDLRHVFFKGTGAVGALATEGATLEVGREADPAEGIEASSVTLDSGSGTLFYITGGGTVARVDYSQLVSHGPIDLAGAITVLVGPSKLGSSSCPVLVPGSTYTFMSTTGTLSGSFANAPEAGPEIRLVYAITCDQLSQTMRIAYHRSAGTETVTGTVEGSVKAKQEEEAAAKKRQEEEAASKKKQEEESGTKRNEEAIKKVAEEHGRQIAEEAAANKKHEEEAASAAAKKQQEEAAKGGVLGAKEGSPDATIASTSLQASGSGAVSIKLSCPAGESGCTGTVTMRTLGAVSASVAGVAEAKATVLTLATGSFAVPGGKVKTVTMHLSPKARALLTHSHVLHVRVTIVAHNPAGATHTGQVIATLRVAKAEHRKG
jgi:hypothetical protein